MTPTDTTELSAAFVAALHAVVPRHPHQRATPWKHTPSARERGRAELTGADLRSFDLVWSGVGPSFLWYGTGHEAYMAELRIGTSYRDVPPDILAQMIGDDGIDLRRMFAQLPEPTTPGLSHVEWLGLGQYEIDDRANVVVEHRFRVYWAQFTD